MTETEAAKPPVTHWRHRGDLAEAVRWDGSPEVLAVLAEWGAEPSAWSPPLAGGVLRIWGSLRGYAGAMPGDWLVRRPGGNGADRYAPEFFEEAFEETDAGGFAPGTGEREACGLLLGEAQDAIEFQTKRADDAEALLARVRELAGDWAADDGQGPPTKEMLVEADCGRAVLNLLNGGQPLNGPHPAVWSDAVAPGGMVCAVPAPGNPDGICGNPVETEPCNQHEEAEGDA